MQRYFLTAESTYEDLRVRLDSQLGYPQASSLSVLTPAMLAPRDSLRRVVMAIDSELPHYDAIVAGVQPLINNGAAQELTEQQYLDALYCEPAATGGGGGGGGSYVLPVATATTLGGVKVGAGLGIDAGVLGVQYGSTATQACRGDDSRLSDSREWSAATVTQAQAESGSSSSRLAFTPQRVFQAIAAWWAASSAKTKLDGVADNATANSTDAQLRDRATHTGSQEISTITGLQTALDGKQAAGSYASATHGHALADLSQSGASTNQVAQWNGSAWVPATVSSGSATTDASQLTAGILNDARLSFIPFHPFLLMGG